MKEDDVIICSMVDIETLSLSKDAEIIEVGFASLVKREGGYKIIQSPDFVPMQNSGHSDDETIAWHLQWRGKDFMQELVKRRADEGCAAETLRAYFLRLGNVPLWCNGASFDFPILSNYFKRFGIPAPWMYTKERDYRTVAKIFHLAKPVPAKPHHAVSDATAQLESMTQNDRFFDFLLRDR